jgi:hypothetical protein
VVLALDAWAAATWEKNGDAAWRLHERRSDQQWRERTLRRAVSSWGHFAGTPFSLSLSLSHSHSHSHSLSLPLSQSLSLSLSLSLPLSQSLSLNLSLSQSQYLSLNLSLSLSHTQSGTSRRHSTVVRRCGERRRRREEETALAAWAGRVRLVRTAPLETRVELNGPC